MTVHTKKKVSILVGICTAGKYRDRRDAVRDTWLRNPCEGIECLFFIGGAGSDPAYQDEGEDMVVLDCSDSYKGLPGKVLAFFRYALEHYDFDWLFKCDDDTYLDLERLSSLTAPGYGLIGDMLVSMREAPSGGAGYFLSHDIVRKIAALSDVPLYGAEDLIFGRLALKLGAAPLATPRLYLSNVKCPTPVNDLVSAHWCSPHILRAMHVIRRSEPAAVYEAVHTSWKDDLLFYREGVFRRRNTHHYGWWHLDEHDILTLRWKEGGEQQLLWGQGSFSGSYLTLGKVARSPSLWEIVPLDYEIEESSPKELNIHLGCDHRRLEGWLNLDMSAFDPSTRFTWKDHSITGFFLENVLEYQSFSTVVHFLSKVRRTLKKDGALRVAFMDVSLLGGEMTPAFRSFQTRHYKTVLPPGRMLEFLQRQLGHQSFWTRESLSAALELSGFAVREYPPGESDNPRFQGLEKPMNPDEIPFQLAGRICLEATLV